MFGDALKAAWQCGAEALFQGSPPCLQVPRLLRPFNRVSAREPCVVTAGCQGHPLLLRHFPHRSTLTGCRLAGSLCGDVTVAKTPKLRAKAGALTLRLAQDLAVELLFLIFQEGVLLLQGCHALKESTANVSPVKLGRGAAPLVGLGFQLVMFNCSFY